LSVYITDTVLAIVDIVSVEDDGQEVAGQIERPVVTLEKLVSARSQAVSSYHVSDCQQNKDERLQSVSEETPKLCQTILEVEPGLDCALLPRQRSRFFDLSGVYSGIDINCSEVLDSKGGGRLPVELGDPVQNIDGLLLFALRKKEFGGFVEVEDDKSEEEDE
jgi:hypothetical protein